VGNLHITIQETLSELGCEPVQFKRPLKNVSAIVRLTKVIEPKNIAQRSQAVGWCLGSLIDRFDKGLFDIKSLTMDNGQNEVTAVAIVHVRGTTFLDNHVAWLDEIIEIFTTTPTPSKGYCWTRQYWSWDTAERISEVTGRAQKDGSGDPSPLECENVTHR